MHPQDVRSFHQGHRVEYRRAVQACLWRAAQPLIDHRLSRQTHQYRQTQLLQLIHLKQQPIVLLERLAEAEARVQDDVFHPQAAQLLHLRGRRDHQLLQRAAYRHQHVGHLQARRHAEHSRTVIIAGGQRLVRHTGHPALAHVVDHVGTILLYSHARHIRTERVYRHHSVATMLLHNLQGKAQTAHLLRLAHLRSSRTGREGTHINQRTALGDDCLRTGGDGSLRLLTAARIERVGRHIHDAHHQRTRQVVQPPSHHQGLVHISCKDNIFLPRKVHITNIFCIFAENTIMS